MEKLGGGGVVVESAVVGWGAVAVRELAKGELRGGVEVKSVGVGAGVGVGVGVGVETGVGV